MNKQCVVVGLLIVYLFAWPGRTLQARDPFSSRLHRTVQQAREHGFSERTTVAQAETVIGQPDNRDWSEMVMVGAAQYRVWVRVEKHADHLKSWRDVLADPRRFGTCYYYLFENGFLKGAEIPAMLSKEPEGLYKLIRPKDQ